MRRSDTEVDERTRALTELTSSFCDAHLNTDYKRLCVKVIREMARMRPVPFLRGNPQIWAAAIVNALGSQNFLFDKSFQPHMSVRQIATLFDASPGSVSNKAASIRQMFDLHPLNVEFMTEDMKSRLAEPLAMLKEIGYPLNDDNAGVECVEIEEGEFIDEFHPGVDAYSNLTERFQQEGPTPALRTSLERLIRRDPDYYDPYLMLYNILSSQGDEAGARALLDTACRRALKRITDSEGNWPARLEWGWLENRHIICTLLNRAIRYWEDGDTQAALDLFRKLLRSSPEDNGGARHYLLAVLLGMTFDEFESKFMVQYGYDAVRIIDWFEENSKRFPDEFGEWWDSVEGQG